MSTGQVSLFGHDEPSFDEHFSAVRRLELAHGAWLEHRPGWCDGHQRLFDVLAEGARWRQEERPMYERVVAVPRSVAALPADGPIPPVIEGMRRALSARYATDFARISLALYRDGRDSVAWHGDYVARTMEGALVATVSLGGARRMLLRPTGGGESMHLDLGWGDLLVMGGTCQRTWQHAVPKVSRAAAPRIAVMFRPVWQE
ncbi:MAG: alpha-ketoglutarate-dependent dioxygenase AlkB [Polyangiaceae bacterium]